MTAKLPTWIYIFAICIAATGTWYGAMRSSFTPDDYVLINTISPIASFNDVAAVFTRHDPNPQYWRPTTNTTYALDFLLWGWDGYLFHLTNILLHALASVIVFFFLRRIFGISKNASALLAIFFAISCSHDSNLLWLSARTDVIATALMMLVIINEYKSQRVYSIWSIISWLLFFFALAAKEISIILLALLPLLSWSNSPKDLWQRKKTIALQLLPYFIITAIFLYIHSLFTVPLSEMQPLTAEGSHSPVAFARNAVYSIGYILFPINFQTASSILNQYATIGFVVAALVGLGLILVIWRYGGRAFLSSLYKPAVLVAIAGLVSFQSFERWRVYFPSVGVLVIVLLVLELLWTRFPNKIARSILIFFIAALSVFHCSRSLYESKVWAKANEHVQRSEDQFKLLLRIQKKRPISYLSIATPIKLGSAQILQVAGAYAMVKAEAEIQYEPNLDLGSLGDAPKRVDFTTVLSSLALDPEEGFSAIKIVQRSAKEFVVKSEDVKKVVFFPEVVETKGVAGRDQRFERGSVIQSYGATIEVLQTEGSFISEALVRITDTTAYPLLFDGTQFRTAW